MVGQLGNGVDWFQSTHPCGVRLNAEMSGTTELMFQSTHPCGVRLCADDFHAARHSFNPRTRVGCDSYKSCEFTGGDVSIHAPVWGATGKITPLVHSFVVSIHAPVWGATRHFVSSRHSPFVSIHAPVWGATTAT